MKRVACIVVLALAFAPALAYGQSAILQGGGYTLGHVPAYVSQGGQPVVVDGGPARGGDVGTGISELGLIARGTGTPPYAGQGTGAFGSIFCAYDAPITNATGYHYVCLSPNSSGGTALISTGAVGAASPIGLNFNIDGTSIVGVTCSGAPSGSFASVKGIVTHC